MTFAMFGITDDLLQIVIRRAGIDMPERPSPECGMLARQTNEHAELIPSMSKKVHDGLRITLRQRAIIAKLEGALMLH